MTEIAHGHINVTLSDQEAISGLRNVDREFDRTMRKIDAKEAEASVGADLTRLRKDLKTAEALVKDWERKVAEARTKGQKRYRAGQLEAARAEAQLVRKAISDEGEKLSVLKQQNRTRDLATAKEKALEQAAQRQVRIQQRLLKEKERNLEMSRKETLEAAKLQQTYSKLQQQLQKLEHRRGGILRKFDRPAQLRLRIETRDVEARIEETRRRLVQLGETPIEIPRDVDRGRLAKWLADLTQMTVRIGPFTTTIAQLGRAMLLLGPIITGLVGALAAVTGAVGAGFVGALGAGAAGLTGFALAAGGIFLIAKPLVKEFINIRKASEAYDKAVREHGAGSDQAAKKLKVLHSVMGHVDDRTVEQFKLLGGLSDRWQRLTRAARPEFFRVVGDGIQTVSDMMPMFARNSVRAFKAVGRGVRDWMEGLRSAEGQRIIDNIMGRFTDSIPSIMRGLGHLGTAAGRVFESFSRHFVGLGRGFESWAKGLADATGRTGKLNSGVDKLVGAMRSVGHFTAAAGRVLIQFFRGGLGPGVGALDSMTKSLNGLAASMGTVEGQRGLRKFFEDSITTTGKFFAAMKPLAEVFFEFTTIMRPFTDAALVGVQAVGELVQVLADLAPSRMIVQALVAAWTAWSIAKILGIAGAIMRVGSALKALAVGQGAMAALSALFAAGGAAGAGRGGGVAGQLAKIGAAAAGGSVAAKVLQGLGRAFLRVAGPAGLAASAALIFGGNAETAATQSRKLTDESRSLGEQITASSRSLAGSYTNIANNSNNLRTSQIEVARAQRTINALQAHGKTGTQEYRDAVAALNIAVQGRAAAEQQVAGSLQNLNRAEQDAGKAARAVTDAQKAYGTAIADVNNHVDKRDDGYKRLIDRYGTLENAPLKYIEQLKALQGHEDDLAAVVDSARGAYDRLNAAERQRTNVLALAQLGQINYQRAIQGMLPVAASAAASVARLNRALGVRKVAQIAIKFPDPRDAARAMQAVDVAIRQGVSRRRALKIILDAKDAETGIAKLRAAVLGIPTKTVNIVEKGGDDAIRKLERIKGTRLTAKEQRIAERGGAGALALLNRLQKTRIAAKQVGVSVKDAATGVIGSIRNMIGSLRDKTVTITTRHRSVGGIGARATGGPITPEEKTINRAAQRAEARMTKNVTGGGVFNRPTFLVGEEDRSEIVIATNPRYRQRNLNFLGMAARALGANATLPDGTVLAQSGYAPGGGYYAPTRLPEAPAAPRGAGRTPRRPKSLRRRQRRVYRSQNAWSAHIARLKTQQDDWEREVSIRQADVQEPDDFIVEIGRTKTVTDPETGEVSGNEPIYGVDDAAVEAFRVQLQAVKDAYDRLVAITAAIVEAVPKAIAANNAEIAVRRENIRGLKRAIADDRPRTRSKSEEARKNAQRRISRNEDRLRREESAMEALRDDNRQLPEDRKDAAFDWRQYTIDSEDIVTQMGGVQGRAAEEAASASAEEPRQSTTGGAGGTGGGLSPDQQAQLDQAGRLKEIVQRGIFTQNAARGVFNGAGDLGFGPFTGAGAVLGGLRQGAGSGDVVSRSFNGGALRSGGSSPVLSARTGQPVGAAAGVAAAGGTVININTLHPADPATLQAIGNAATAGQAGQGFVVSPRERTGA